MPPFFLDPEANSHLTHRIGQIEIVPRRLVDRFGPPSESDGYKVSGQYCFQDAQGRVYTLYDWKETSLFTDGLEEGEESPLPTPADFWAGNAPTTLNIGGRDDNDLAAFKTWLVGEIA